MEQAFKGWGQVANNLRQRAEQEHTNEQKEGKPQLNQGQRASLLALADRIPDNGVVIADEVGMGKTRIAVALALATINAGGRVALLVPPGLGYQWHDELEKGNVKDVPLVLRSLQNYLDAWSDQKKEQSKPWHDCQTVLISHSFGNWNLGTRTKTNWRWALLPEVLAYWRKEILNKERFPRGYYYEGKLGDDRVKSAALSIIKTITASGRKKIEEIFDRCNGKWGMDSSLMKPENYGNNSELRGDLETVVGVGLGEFDLIIIDEAHKSRGSGSGLSRLLNDFILSSPQSRRLAITATPVELDVQQWLNTLRRIGLTDDQLAPVNEAINGYAEAVQNVRDGWRSNPDVRERYKGTAKKFEKALFPYLLRRGKCEDPHVKKFMNQTKLAHDAYRQEKEIIIDIQDQDHDPYWKHAICAAESLSFVARMSDDATAKRLRLTFGNGHGIATLVSSIRLDEENKKQETYDQEQKNTESDNIQSDSNEKNMNEWLNNNNDVRTKNGRTISKREQRVAWWRNQIVGKAYAQQEDSLYSHPAILAAVKAIEEATKSGEKVLVFGRFTRPLRALTQLLNAREMLDRLEKGQHWPQTKVYGDYDGLADISNNQWPAVRAAHRQQPKCSIVLKELDTLLKNGYKKEQERRQSFRENLIDRIAEGLQSEKVTKNSLVLSMFAAFKRSEEAYLKKSSAKRQNSDEENYDQSTDVDQIDSPLILVSRSITELLGTSIDDTNSTHLANTFISLIKAISDKDYGDINNRNKGIDDEAVEDQWAELEIHLREQYKATQGRFARLMYGGTSQPARRTIQLAFNHHNSFLKVLVAQSIVGREGLDLHEACRIVILLHPEWNPGIVEQQIGRVDRVNSHWCRSLDEAIKGGMSANKLPQIEFRPVIFKGTYDEYNWKVLQKRWNNLRAQLHGIVISNSQNYDEEDRDILSGIHKSAPNFSPSNLFDQA